MGTTHLFLTLMAASGEHGEVNWFAVGSMIVNFFLFFGFLGYVLRRPVKGYLETRRENMAVQLREAQTRQAEAERKLAEYEGKLANLEGEVQRIVKSFEAQGEADRERLKNDADRAMERLVREVDFTLRQESLKAQREIREAGVKATLAMAEQMITERITDADRRRLADEYIGQVAPTPSIAPKA